MAATAQGTIHIQWRRSGIGFTRRQKEMVRSLGLRRLNEVVERPDTPQIRGLVAAIPHLVEIVSAPAVPAWMAVKEYELLPPDPAEARPVRRRAPKPAAPEAPPEQPKAAEEKPVKAAPAAKASKPRKAPAQKEKPAKAAGGKKAKTASKPKATKKSKK